MMLTSIEGSGWRCIDAAETLSPPSVYPCIYLSLSLSVNFFSLSLSPSLVLFSLAVSLSLSLTRSLARSSLSLSLSLPMTKTPRRMCLRVTQYHAGTRDSVAMVFEQFHKLGHDFVKLLSPLGK